MAVVRKLACTVRTIVDHGERVYTVELEPASPAPRFTPGQFLHLALDPYEGDGFWPESRVFSIASSPSDRDRLEVTYAVKGPYTQRMERELRVAGTVWVKLPYGEFVIERGRDAVLFAGGTGVTAFAAFLHSLNGAPGPQVRLFYGARTQQLFAYRGLIEAAVPRSPGLACTYVCEETDGRLSVDAAWPTIAALDDPVFYLSGPPPMLATLTDQLRGRGVAAGDIRTDAWE